MAGVVVRAADPGQGPGPPRVGGAVSGDAGGPGAGASISVDVFDPTPPYEQIRRQIVALVSSGALAPGDRLPTVRQLADDLGLAAGTVARAYRELETTGWLQTRRGAGTRVGATPPRPAADAAALRQLADEFVRRARFLGADDTMILSRVTDALF